MLLAEYSYETDIMVKQEEARQETLLLTAKVFQELRENPVLMNERLAKKLGYSVSEIETIREAIGI